MKENKYDHDSVQELLTWAKGTLENKSYPEGKLQINPATTILDCRKFLESMIAMIDRNQENLTFYPTINHLREFRNRIDGRQERG